MAVKTARDWARAKRPEVAAPEMVVAHTAHASLDKAAHLLGLKVVRMKENVDFGADLAGMERAVGAQTIMIVGSAPPAPYGQVDPIAEIAALARRHGLWMHVDGCMGGFFLPFAKKLGEPIPDFDFAVPGVMSMSADLHKFGLAPKGASLILFADPEVGRFQSFEFSDWPYGTYVTANFAGSRPAAPIAAAWAVMNHLGEEGYLAVVRRLIEWRKQLIAGVLAIDGLGIVGRPSTAHFNVFAKDFDIYAVDEILAERGWHTGRGRSPDSIQFWVNYANERSFEALLADLKDAVATVRRTGRVRRVSEAVYSRS
jgi:glutamate/tyrosine decarboxylase-like PLP-dependent enzyme